MAESSTNNEQEQPVGSYVNPTKNFGSRSFPKAELKRQNEMFKDFRKQRQDWEDTLTEEEYKKHVQWSKAKRGDEDNKDAIFRQMKELFDEKMDDEGLIQRANFAAFMNGFTEIGRSNGLEVSDMSETQINEYWELFNNLDSEVAGITFDHFEHSLAMIAL